tara:strand:+ start:341 stop:580 length:240 start_codon:yes stop_codon:yes gene_type:complete
VEYIDLPGLGAHSASRHPNYPVPEPERSQLDLEPEELQVLIYPLRRFLHLGRMVGPLPGELILHHGEYHAMSGWRKVVT